MNDERLLEEIKEAARARERRRKELADANLHLIEARDRLSRTAEGKAVRQAKLLVRECTLNVAEACESIEAMEAELLTGETGLPIFDRSRANANGHAAPPDAPPHSTMAASTEGIAAAEAKRNLGEPTAPPSRSTRKPRSPSDSNSKRPARAAAKEGTP